MLKRVLPCRPRFRSLRYLFPLVIVGEIVVYFLHKIAEIRERDNLFPYFQELSHLIPMFAELEPPAPRNLEEALVHALHLSLKGIDDYFRRPERLRFLELGHVPPLVAFPCGRIEPARDIAPQLDGVSLFHETLEYERAVVVEVPRSRDVAGIPFPVFVG